MKKKLVGLAFLIAIILVVLTFMYYQQQAKPNFRIVNFRYWSYRRNFIEYTGFEVQIYNPTNREIASTVHLEQEHWDFDSSQFRQRMRLYPKDVSYAFFDEIESRYIDLDAKLHIWVDIYGTGEIILDTWRTL